MTDENRDELDEETKELVDQVDEQIDRSATPNEDSNPQGSTGENTTAEPTESDSKAAGATAGLITGTAKAIAKFPLAVASKLPKKTKIYQGMIRAGYQGMWKNTKGNVVVNTIYGDREVIPYPAEIDDEEQKVRTTNGMEWSLPDGLQTYHMGESRVMWGVADAHELVSPVGARTAEKIDLDDAVYVQQQRRQQQNAAMAGAGQNSAIADGGLTPSGLNARSTTLWDGEPFEDVFVNWANDNPDADGMIVSLEKHYELQHSQAGAEEMKKQEDRGRLAERFDGGKKTGLIYVGLLLLGIAVGLFGPGLAGSLGGAEGGTSVSLMIHAGHLMGMW